MSWTILQDLELERLAASIGEIEKTTSGEVRLMIVRKSAASGHVMPLLFLILAQILYFGTMVHEVQALVPVGLHPWLPYLVVAVSFGLALVLSRSAMVQRLLTSRADMNNQVLARAEVEFHREGMDQTRSQTGILLMLSMAERQAVVLADKGIAVRVPSGTWDKVIALVVEGAKGGALAAKLDEALRLCGKYLSEHFPPEPGDTNELSNAVIVKD
jgi:putative membrane protein